MMDKQNITKPDDGGSAFPVNTANINNAGAFEPETGMMLRDYFAAKALQGLLSDAWMKSDNSSIQSFADEAYNWADAMIKARNGGAA